MSAPGGWVVAAVVAEAVALGVTASLAAPLHGALTHRDDVLLARLLRVDRVRAAAAVAGLGLALLALASG